MVKIYSLEVHFRTIRDQFQTNQTNKTVILSCIYSDRLSSFYLASLLRVVGANLLTVFLAYLSGVSFWHSSWHGSMPLFATSLKMFVGILRGISSGILSGIRSHVWLSFCHTIQHSFLVCFLIFLGIISYLANLSALFLSDILSDISSGRLPGMLLLQKSFGLCLCWLHPTFIAI